MPRAEAAERLAAFWDRAYTEYNVAKAMVPAPPACDTGDGRPGAASRAEGEQEGRPPARCPGDLAGAVGVRQALGPAGERQVRSPESISYEAHAHCLLDGLDMSPADEAR